jgi:hypothetical protein
MDYKDILCYIESLLKVFSYPFKAKIFIISPNAEKNNDQRRIFGPHFNRIVLGTWKTL